MKASLSKHSSAEPRPRCSLQPVGTGRYDSLQAQLQRRFVAGLSLGVNYTLGRAKSPNENSSGTPNVQALTYMDRNYALTNSDRTHNLGITNVWQLPLGPGRPWLNDKSVMSYIFGGWQINNMVSIMSGVPFSVFADGTSLNLPGTNQTADQVKPTRRNSAAWARTTPYYDPTAFAEVTDARFGNTGYNILRGPGLFNWDFGLLPRILLHRPRQAAVPCGGVQFHEHAAPRDPRQRRRRWVGFHDDYERAGSRPRGDR